MSTINSVTAAAYTTTAYESKAAAKKENTEATTEKSYGKDVGVVYEKSSKTVENAGTYKKTRGKTNTALIENCLLYTSFGIRVTQNVAIEVISNACL